ncbi:MATE family efflux transporter [Streptococcus caprae]|uniref:Probable multidrug resistance protein NorM n=1 Tax=Streptococcus caprae TaxID=1640501 RepID=A0ABV8CW18_9STRE
MHSTQTTKEKLMLFVTIFFPVLIYQLANFSASFLDTMMTGHYATKHLAGVSMATSLWNPMFSFLTGLVSALVPVIGHHLGRKEQDKVTQEFHQFLYLGLGLSLVLMAVVAFGARPFLATMGLEPEVLAVGQAYLDCLLVGIVPLSLFSICRSFFDALGLTRLSMYLMLLILPFNAFFNYGLIYGRFGFPEMGGAGAGLGTSLTYWAVLLVVLFVMARHPKVRAYKIWQLDQLQPKLVWSGFRLGLPIGLQVFVEVAIFAAMGLMMAQFSSEIIAAHQSAMNFATLMYAFPASISSALAIVISYEVGARRVADVQAYTRIGRWFALGFATLTLTFLYTFRFQVAGLYGTEQSFIRTTAVFLTYSLFFQLADAYAAPIQGILRGYKDTTMPFIIGFVGYWAAAFPIGMALNAWTNLGPYAYWIGLISGIIICGIFLNIRLNKMAKKLNDRT